MWPNTDRNEFRRPITELTLWPVIPISAEIAQLIAVSLDIQGSSVLQFRDYMHSRVAPVDMVVDVGPQLATCTRNILLHSCTKFGHEPIDSAPGPYPQKWPIRRCTALWQVLSEARRLPRRCLAHQLYFSRVIKVLGRSTRTLYRIKPDIPPQTQTKVRMSLPSAVSLSNPAIDTKAICSYSGLNRSDPRDD